MKFLSRFNARFFLLICLAWILIPTSIAQVPAKPQPPRLVNDLAGLLDRQQAARLEDKLVRFNDTATTQISVVTIPDLGGYDVAEMAIRIGESWGVGQKSFDNGVVVLVKPKAGNQAGEVFIATGYGLEGVIPDAMAKRIVENEMIPHFKSGNYQAGIEAGVDALIALSSGEYKANKQAEEGLWGVLLLIVLVILVIALFSRKHSGMKTLGSGEIPFWVWLAMMNSGKGGKSTGWGGFPGGGRSGGGFGGGFGGFGGGSFGGGGAGGRW